MKKASNFKRILAARACSRWRQTVSSRARAVLAVPLLAAISLLAAALVLPSRMMANDTEIRTFTVDVAFGLPSFQNNIDPAETAQNPFAFSPGDTFLQDGNIYPEGTIPNGKTDFDPDTPGAIGKYRARGTWTTDLANFERASEKDRSAAPDLGFATEMFSLGNDRGTILTDGTLPNAYFAARRVVLGGTGSFQKIVGEVHEQNIGENKLGFCNLRVTFKVRNVGEGDVH
jgi:hypothetical protein